MKKWMKVTLWMVALSLCLLLPKQTVKASTDYNLGSLKKSGSVTVIREQTAQTNPSDGLDETDYFKFKAPSSGYVVFTANNIPKNVGDNLHLDVFLCNAKRKEITDTKYNQFVISEEESITFAIAKGKTYYLRVDTYDEEYQLDYKFTKVKEKTGNNKKSKAATIKKKKLVKGLLMAGEKKADWYKIKLTKKQVLYLTVSVKSHLGINVDVYDKDGEEIDGLDFYQPASENETKTMYSENWSGKKMKLKPGTYYVKVYVNKDARGCGYYSLKWK